jgi:hypothetical protein
VDPLNFGDDLVERVPELELTEPPQFIEPLREPAIEFVAYDVIDEVLRRARGSENLVEIGFIVRLVVTGRDQPFGIRGVQANRVNCRKSIHQTHSLNQTRAALGFIGRLRKNMEMIRLFMHIVDISEKIVDMLYDLNQNDSISFQFMI